MRNRGFAALFLILVLSVTTIAVTPRFFENFVQADLLAGSLDHISLTSDGRLFLSPVYDMAFDTGQPYIFSMVRDSLGNIYVGTGDDGRVYKIDPQGKGTLYFKAEEINIFAMAVDASDCLYVGTSPDGKIYKVTASNQATEFFDSDDKYIWSMVFDDANNLYVGTGGGGVVYKVENDGGSAGSQSVFFQCGDSHVVCLARDGSGNLLAGTSPSGLVIKINSEGKGFTLMDTPMEEVHSFALNQLGAIIAVTSSYERVEQKSESHSDGTADKAGMTSAASMRIESVVDLQKPQDAKSVTSVPDNRGSSSNRSIVYMISKDGSSETVYASKEQRVFDSIMLRDGTLLLATGPKGRLLSIDTAKQVSVISDTSVEHLTRLLTVGDTVYAGGSNQGKVFKLEPKSAGKGVFESQILDAKTVSLWGKIFWHISNPNGARFEVSTRSGNTAKIDNSWSNWSAEYTNSGQQIVSPEARYMQWRVSVFGGSVAVRNPSSDLMDRVRISYLQQNLRPQVLKLEVLPYGIEFRKQSSLTLGSASLVTSVTAPDGSSLNAPRERGNNTLTLQPGRALQPGAQSFSWNAVDENQDSLEYALYFKGESDSDWKLLEEKYEETYYTLHFAVLPDGIYRLKVVASDAPSNPYNNFLISEMISQPFVIINTPPTVKISDYTIDGGRASVIFDARVTTGNVATSEFSVDGGDWNLVFPVDGIADSEYEEYRIVIPDLLVGEHLISIRASDRDGNTGISKVIVRIP